MHSTTATASVSSRIGRVAGIEIIVGPARRCYLVRFIGPVQRYHHSQYSDQIADSPLCSLGFRERQFMRALAQEAYEAELQFISEEQVMPMISHYQVFTLFDFTCTPVEVTVLSVDESPLAKTLEDAGPEWTGLLARMRDSHGCMQVHVMQVCEGSKNRVWVVPLRSSSPYIHDALRDIANYFSEGTEFPTYEEVTVKVEPILDDIGDLVEIH